MRTRRGCFTGPGFIGEVVRSPSAALVHEPTTHAGTLCNHRLVNSIWSLLRTVATFASLKPLARLLLWCAQRIRGGGWRQCSSV